MRNCVSVPTQWYHNEDAMIDSLKVNLDRMQPDILSRHSTPQENQQVNTTNTTNTTNNDPAEQAWFADTTRLMELLRRNLSNVSPSM